MSQAAKGNQAAVRTSTKVLVYQMLAEDIKALGVDCVFGLMSDDTALFATALDTMGVRLYGTRHENMAIVMAEGYAYATGKLAIAIVGRGPALANGLHGAVYANRTGSKVLIISGEAATPGGVAAPQVKPMLCAPAALATADRLARSSSTLTKVLERPKSR